MWKIKKQLIQETLIAAKKSYPKEFICFLGGEEKNKLITEFVFLPNETSTNSAVVYQNSIPFDDTIIGTLHSHPDSTNTASFADKQMFSRYKINLILGYPFVYENIIAYDENSKKIEFELI